MIYEEVLELLGLPDKRFRLSADDAEWLLQYLKDKRDHWYREKADEKRAYEIFKDALKC